MTKKGNILEYKSNVALEAERNATTIINNVIKKKANNSGATNAMCTRLQLVVVLGNHNGTQEAVNKRQASIIHKCNLLLN